jgi:hypothetical protein
VVEALIVQMAQRELQLGLRSHRRCVGQPGPSRL